jgi:hypothetical protein
MDNSDFFNSKGQCIFLGFGIISIFSYYLFAYCILNELIATLIRNYQSSLTRVMLLCLSDFLKL